MKWTQHLDKLTDSAKKALDSRGGTDGLKRDVERMRDIAMGEGSPKERAQQAVDHFKQPGEGGAAGGEKPAGESGSGGSSGSGKAPGSGGTSESGETAE